MQKLELPVAVRWCGTGSTRHLGCTIPPQAGAAERFGFHNPEYR